MDGINEIQKKRAEELIALNENLRAMKPVSDSHEESGSANLYNAGYELKLAADSVGRNKIRHLAKCTYWIGQEMKDLSDQIS